MTSASGYSFSHENERIQFRNEAVLFGITIMNTCQINDAYILNSIADIVQKILTAYGTRDFGSRKP